MTRIAILGANGQVGAELCLLLRRVPGVEIVPVCRSRLGSAYLRYCGVACRHGRLEDREEAQQLLGDCDVVVNLVLISSTADPAGARRAMDRLLDHVASVSGKRAAHVFFSTMSVYGDREAGQWLAVRNSYAQDKLRCERVALRSGRRHGCRTVVLRLGHVCGELQGITQQMRELIGRGPVPLPDPERDSNTTHVAAIADAVLQVAAGRVVGGVHDLMNTPQWSWRQVFEHEARVIGRPLELVAVGDPRHPGLRAQLRTAVGAALSFTRNQPSLRRLGSRLLQWLPASIYTRLRTAHAIRSAAAEIRTLRPAATPVLEAALRSAVRIDAPPGLTNTAELLTAPLWRTDPADPRWPADLRPHAPEEASAPIEPAACRG